MIYEKTDKEGLVRDMNSNAILNKDDAALVAYKNKRKNSFELISFKQKFEEREKKLDLLENDLDEIKNMLKVLSKKILDSAEREVT